MVQDKPIQKQRKQGNSRRGNNGNGGPKERGEVKKQKDDDDNHRDDEGEKKLNSKNNARSKQQQQQQSKNNNSNNFSKQGSSSNNKSSSKKSSSSTNNNNNNNNGRSSNQQQSKDKNNKNNNSSHQSSSSYSATNNSKSRQQQSKNNTNNNNDSSQQGSSSSTNWRQQQSKNNNSSSQHSSSNNNKSSKKSYTKTNHYPPYKKLSDLMDRYLKQDPNLIRGKIRMCPGKDSAAFVACDRGSLHRDVVITTMRDKNRSLNRDLVFCELLPPEEEDDEDNNKTTTTTIIQQTRKAMENLKIADDDYNEEEDNNELGVVTWQDDSLQASLWDPQIAIPMTNPMDDDGDSFDDLPQYNGCVVLVVPPKESAGTQASELGGGSSEKRKPRRTIVGTIHSIKTYNSKTISYFRPNTRSMTDFLCPMDFESSGDGLYKAEYVYGNWKEFHKNPPCVKVKKLGDTCNIHDETLALLTENGIDQRDFGKDVLKDVQDAVQSGLMVADSDGEELGWKPTPDMYQGRRDYRQQRIFTIDPTTAKDLDDALHIQELPDGRVEIGVHIADVSYFMQPGSEVDKEATRRATTVYLVDRVIPMLPRPLCEVACSLNENVERLAFSCVWKMNLDGSLQSPNNSKDEVWYGRTVIKSCARLDYSTAQNIIDSKDHDLTNNDSVDESMWPMSRRPTGGHTMNEVAADVRLMHKVAMARRKLRFDNGALALNGVKLSFRLDSDGETPMMCAPYPIRDSNRLVEEYMLLANYLVAQRLLQHTKLAVIRMHPPPLTMGLKNIVEIGKEIGFHIDTKDSKSLQESLNRLGRECNDELVIKLITELLMTPMRPAEYIVSGDHDRSGWRHFALNIPYYTHFTSPIRRYADVMVHRLLQATIDGNVDELFKQKEREMQDNCANCNDRKAAAKTAQDRSDRIFLAMYVRKNPIRSKLGVVISVGEKTFKVFVEELGCSAMLFLDEHKGKLLESTEPYKTEKGQRGIKLKRNKDNNNKNGDWSEIDIKVFTKLTVSVICKEKPPIDIKIELEGPWKE